MARPHTRRDNILYWTLVMIGVVALFLSLYLPDQLSVQIVIPFALVYRLSMELLLCHLIKKREAIPSLAELAFRHNKFDLYLSIGVIILLIGILFTDYHFSVFPVAVLMINVGTPSIRNIFLVNANVPQYILTEDKFIVNNFSIEERKLSDLHSISIDGFFPHVRITFSDTYDIKIRKSHYTTTELAAFIQSVIDAAPVDPIVDAEVKSLLLFASFEQSQ